MGNKDFYLKSVEVEGYKSIQRAEILFQPGLNIIIGANGSGKTNFLLAINSFLSGSFLRWSNIISDSFERLSVRFTNNRKDLIAKCEFVEDAFHVSYNETQFKVKLTENAPAELYNIHSGYFPNGSYAFIGFGVKEGLDFLDIPVSLKIAKGKSLKKAAGSQGESNNAFIKKFEFFLADDFSRAFQANNAQLDASRAKNQLIERWELLHAHLEQYFLNYLRYYSSIKDLRLTPNINYYSTSSEIILDNILFEFLVNEKWIPWHFLSDGSKRMFYIISEIALDNERILLIEEPELGIHPHQLHLLMQLIKDQSDKNQIIVTTHSPQVLDIIGADELNRIIIAEMTNDGTKLRHMSQDEIAKAHVYMKDEGFLSDYWKYSDLENFVI